MAGLILSLLGPFQVVRDDEPLTAFATDAARALLAYLAADKASGEAHALHRRQALAGLLWPERPERQAMQNLRQTLTLLRQVLGERDAADAQDHPYLLVTRQAIGLHPEADCWSDVAAFGEAIAAARAHPHRRLEACPACIARLRQAVELYRGEFMAGFSLPSAPFEEWLLARRETLRLQALDALYVLAAHHERRGEHEPALRYARRQLELEPWREAAHRQCMRALALSGQRAAALAQYEACQRALAEELGVEPEAETTRLYEEIRDHSETGFLPETRFLNNLPAQTTPFVGRERELAQIGAHLCEPSCRLVALVGPGGSGKTRLALEAAEQVDAFRDGVCFVSLAPVASPEGMVPAIAQALGLTFHAGEDPQQQLVRYLRPKELLLVLDNLEHLGEGMGLLGELLSAAPALWILATSRTRLGLQGEQVLLVGGMECPPLTAWERRAPARPPAVTPGPSPGGRGELDDALRYSAVALFLHAVRRARPGYEPSADDLAQVARLCRLVEGMPLALLLAAAWADALSPAQIAAEVAQGVDFLEAELRDLPERQRSMRAVCEASWQLLSEREQRAFTALCVFRGGFTAAAAQEVSEADLRALVGLVRKSFLQVEASGRYQVHELLRQYGEERLDQSTDGGQGARDRHAAYYAAAAGRWETGLKGRRAGETLAEMAVEIHNAEVAWEWLSERGDVVQLGEMIHAVGQFYASQGSYQQGETSFVLVDRLLLAEQAATPDVAVLLHVRARLLTWRGRYAFISGRRTQTAALMRQAQEALDEAERGGQDVRAARAWMLHSSWEQVADIDRPAGRPIAEQSLALYRELDNPWGIVCGLADLGISSFFDGAYPTARRIFEERLSLSRQWGIGDDIGIDSSIFFLSLIAAFRGEAEWAERMAREWTAPMLASDHMTRAWGLYVLGTVLQCCGQYAAAEPLLEEGVALLRELGANVLLYRLLGDLTHTKLHLGQYERANELGREQLGRARQTRAGIFAGLALTKLARISTVVGTYQEAVRTLEEGIALLRRAGARAYLGTAQGCMAFVARGLGPTHHVWEWVRQALRLGVECEDVKPLLLALSAAALLLADRGEAERAVELYTLAWHFPIVSNSRWYEDVAGQELAVVAAGLPSEVRAAAQARGHAHDLWAMAQELLAELG